MSFQIAELPRSAWFLVGANAVALLGVLLLGWSLGEIMLLYWLESAIIGVVTVLKMLSKRHWGALFTVPFFCFHYGMFMSVHLVFLVAFFFESGIFGVTADLPSTVARISPAMLALAVSHGASFWMNWVQGGERERQDLGEIMGSPYPRIVVMHVTIILGGMLVAALGAPILALAVLLALKAAVDVAAHRRERQRLASKTL